MMNRLTKVSQDRWNEIFEAGANYEGEQTYIDFDRKIPIGKNPSLIEHLSTIAYYDKSFVANLKAILAEWKVDAGCGRCKQDFQKRA